MVILLLLVSLNRLIFDCIFVPSRIFGICDVAGRLALLRLFGANRLPVAVLNLLLDIILLFFLADDKCLNCLTLLVDLASSMSNV